MFCSYSNGTQNETWLLLRLPTRLQPSKYYLQSGSNVSTKHINTTFWSTGSLSKQLTLFATFLLNCWVCRWCKITQWRESIRRLYCHTPLTSYFYVNSLRNKNNCRTNESCDGLVSIFCMEQPPIVSWWSQGPFPEEGRSMRALDCRHPKTVVCRWTRNTNHYCWNDDECVVVVIFITLFSTYSSYSLKKYFYYFNSTIIGDGLKTQSLLVTGIRVASYPKPVCLGNRSVLAQTVVTKTLGWLENSNARPMEVRVVSC